MGYDVNKVVAGLQDDLLCCKCKQVLEDPIKATCGHTCCRNCVKTGEGGKKKAIKCTKCGSSLIKDDQGNIEDELRSRLGQVSIQCILGCKITLSLDQMQNHVRAQCQLRQIVCVNRGCLYQCAVIDLDRHLIECDYRLVQCEVCGTCVSFRDMPAHQAVKRCYQQQLKAKRIASARRLSSELKEHRLDLQQQKHLTDQAERRLVKEHYEKQKVEYLTQRRRAQSANAVLSQSIQARVGSAIVTPKYSRTLSQTTALSCLTCENRFLAGRRPSARRHSHTRVI